MTSSIDMSPGGFIQPVPPVYPGWVFEQPLKNTHLPALNVGLLRDLVIWAAKDQAMIDQSADYFARVAGWGQWEQAVWADVAREGTCRSSYCIAGQAVAQSDYVLLLDGDGFGSADYCAPLVQDGVKANGKPNMVPDMSRTEAIWQKAMRDIGLTQEEEGHLFDGDNDLERIVSLSLAIARRRGLDLALPSEIALLDLGYDDDDETWEDDEDDEVDF